MVVLASGGKSCCTRSGQSAEVLSQKRHRLGLGTRLASMYAAMLRLKFPRLVTKSSSAASGGDIYRVVGDPLGLVEVGRGPGPSAVIGLGPAHPFAGVLASGEFGSQVVQM